MENPILNEVVSQITINLNKQLDDCLIEGLRRKGFEFDNGSDLRHFVELRCKCEDDVQLKERVYYVDDIPFFIHKYDSSIMFDSIQTGNSNTIVADMGSFLYV